MTSPMTSSPPLRWSDLTAARVGLWGLGVEGSANLAKLLSLGIEPVIADDRPSSKDAHGIPVLPTGQGGWEALATCQVVVKTPGISRYRPDVVALEERGVVLAGGLGLWLHEADPQRVVCITGTKGKSTTAAIAGHLARALGRRCLVAGNIGRLPYDPNITEEPELTVVEVSSFQATDLRCSPPVVAVTSLHPDHLDWHGSVERYYADKLSICTKPGADLVIADGTSAELAAQVHQLGKRIEWISQPSGGSWADALGLRGSHNRRNALIARACLLASGVQEAADDDLLETAAQGFTPLDSRLVEIGSLSGVTFVDDSLSTNALAAIAAIECFDSQPLAIILGGADRGIDYTALAERIVARREPTFVVTMPASGARMHATLDAVTQDHDHLDVTDTDDLQTAVAKAFSWATPGAVVLMSPAAASFGQFRNYKERSAAFRDILASLEVEGSATQ
ncbi:MAG: UDP-N-acetylmuramoyl-L-alanine--D-glutamate ligase [Acidimicrobiales bacterium]